MEYREVGNTGVQVSEIGFGGGGNAGLMVRGTPEQQREAVARAIELGINYFDQAPDYGRRRLGDEPRPVDEGARIPAVSSPRRSRCAPRTWTTSPATWPARSTRAWNASASTTSISSRSTTAPLMERPELSGRGYARLWIEDYLRSGRRAGRPAARAGKRQGAFHWVHHPGRQTAKPRAGSSTPAPSASSTSRCNLLNPPAGMKPYGMTRRRRLGWHPGLCGGARRGSFHLLPRWRAGS